MLQQKRKRRIEERSATDREDYFAGIDEEANIADESRFRVEEKEVSYKLLMSNDIFRCSSD